MAVRLASGCSQAEALDAGQDVVGGLDPAERLGLGVGALDEQADVALEISDGSVAPRRICLSVSRPNQRSTWLIQEAEVGVKWT